MKKVGVGSGLSGLSGLSSIAGATVSFAGFLDAVSNVEHVYLLFRGLSSYTGNLVRLRRDSDNAEADFTWDSSTLEFLDTAAVTAWLSGANPFVVTSYDQAAAGDDITQATAGNQPALTLSNAAVNNRSTMLFSAHSLAGPFTTGGALSQPFTTYPVAALNAGVINDNVSRNITDGDDITNRMIAGKYDFTSPDNWRIFNGINLFNVAADAAWHIWTTLSNGASSQFWIDGISITTGNAGTHTPDGITIGARYDTASLYWIGSIIGVVVIAGNSSTADKNVIGNKFETVYGISYTDIV